MTLNQVLASVDDAIATGQRVNLGSGPLKLDRTLHIDELKGCILDGSSGEIVVIPPNITKRNP